MSKKQFAFTLIELLVVIAIIGILSSLIVVSMSGVTEKANIAKAQVFSNSLRNALMLNLVSEWKFDGSTLAGNVALNSDVLDSWGSNHGNVATHQPTVRSDSSCVQGSCLEFNGSSGYISIADSDSLDIGISDLSIEFWIKTSQANVGGVFHKNYQPGYSIVIGDVAAGKLKLELGDSSGYATVPTNSLINNNKWRHVVISIDRDVSAKWYIDGIVDNTGTGVTTRQGSLTNTASPSIGLYSTIYFSGLLDNFRIYNSAVPISLIRRDYYIGLNNLLINGGITKDEYLSRINNIANK